MKPILIGYKSKTRILRPSEFEQLLEGIKKDTHRLNIKIALLTGLRFRELQEFQNHPDWFDGNFIYIEEKKRKRTQRQRWVRLNELAKHLIPFFFKSSRIPSIQVWNRNLKRWAIDGGIDPTGITAKTTRKTWESWLVMCYPDLLPFIVDSQGHTELISVRHYRRLPFTEDDKRKMMNWVQGWDKGLEK